MTGPETASRFCRTFGHPLDPLAADEGFSDCRACGQCSYSPLPRLVQPLRAAWEVAWVACHVASVLLGPVLPDPDEDLPF